MANDYRQSAFEASQERRFPDDPVPVKELLADRPAADRDRLRERDDFIVQKGLWREFVDWLPRDEAKATAAEEVCPRCNSASAPRPAPENAEPPIPQTVVGHPVEGCYWHRPAPEAMEEVAQAMWESIPDRPPWDSLSGSSMDLFRTYARAALAAARPEGWRERLRTISAQYKRGAHDGDGYDSNCTCDICCIVEDLDELVALPTPNTEPASG